MEAIPILRRVSQWSGSAKWNARSKVAAGATTCDCPTLVTIVHLESLDRRRVMVYHSECQRWHHPRQNLNK